MRTVWKYQLKATEVDGQACCFLEMPAEAQVLHVSAHTGEPCLWALVDPNRPKEMRRFLVLGTGHGGPDGLDAKRYVGTFFIGSSTIGMMQGLPNTLVFHVFEA